MEKLGQDKFNEICRRVKQLSESRQEELMALLESWQSEQQRAFIRTDHPTAIDVLVGDRVVQTDTRDVSAGGVFIRAKGQFDPATTVKVVFSLPGSDRPFKLDGTIVRSDSDGFAVVFTKISTYMQQMIDQAISGRPGMA